MDEQTFCFHCKIHEIHPWSYSPHGPNKPKTPKLKEGTPVNPLSLFTCWVHLHNTCRDYPQVVYGCLNSMSCEQCTKLPYGATVMFSNLSYGIQSEKAEYKKMIQLYSLSSSKRSLLQKQWEISPVFIAQIRTAVNQESAKVWDCNAQNIAHVLTLTVLMLLTNSPHQENNVTRH